MVVCTSDEFRATVPYLLILAKVLTLIWQEGQSDHACKIKLASGESALRICISTSGAQCKGGGTTLALTKIAHQEK
jgi:hypothetical protein